jgi:hypothetical protein
MVSPAAFVDMTSTFGSRMDCAQLIDLSGPDGEQVLRELQLAALRNSERLAGVRNQSELMRAAAELIVTAVEKVERDRELGDAYAAERRSAARRSWRSRGPRPTRLLAAGASESPTGYRGQPAGREPKPPAGAASG